jgi:gas vesicle protein
MFALLRTSIRFFVIGFIVGTLFAPRSGVETRRMLSDKLTIVTNQILEVAALPPIEERGAVKSESQTRRTARGTNARSSS